MKVSTVQIGANITKAQKSMLLELGNGSITDGIKKLLDNYSKNYTLPIDVLSDFRPSFKTTKYHPTLVFKDASRPYDDQSIDPTTCSDEFCTISFSEKGKLGKQMGEMYWSIDILRDGGWQWNGAFINDPEDDGIPYPDGDQHAGGIYRDEFE